MRGNWRPNKTATYWPPLLSFLSRSPELLNRGPGGPASLGHSPHSSIFSPTDLNTNCSLGSPERPLCWVLVLSTASFLQLVWTSCCRGYIIIWRPFFFLRASQFCTQFNPSTGKVISWYSSTGCACYLHRCISYFDSLARVGGQYATYWPGKELFYLCVHQSTAQFPCLTMDSKSVFSVSRVCVLPVPTIRQCTVLYSHMQIHEYTCRIIHKDTMIKDERRLL